MKSPYFSKPFIIAEIGCNHMGSLEIAKEMIHVASDFCQVSAVKLQKRNPRECLSEEEFCAPHPVPYNSFGETYGEHREFLEFSVDEHTQLNQYANTKEVIYSISVWDISSAEDAIILNPPFVKIPSACNTHFSLLDKLAQDYSGEIHISLGMTTRQEEYDIVDFLNKRDALHRVVLYACTSGYPVKDEDVCLLEVKRLKKSYGNLLRGVGFSGHHLGISLDIAAATLGATYFERHFTLDRTQKGTDHAASLEPDGMRRLVRDLRCLEKALRFKDQDILPVEEPQRQKLKWNRKELSSSGL